MTTINKRSKEELLAKLKNRLEDSWSSISQVIEELEEFEYEAQTNLDDSIKNNIDTPEKEMAYIVALGLRQTNS